MHGVLAVCINGLRICLIGKCCHHLFHVKYSRGNTNLMEGEGERVGGGGGGGGGGRERELSI